MPPPAGDPGGYNNPGGTMPYDPNNPGGGYYNPGGDYNNPGGGYYNPGGGYNNPGGGYYNPGGGYNNPGDFFPEQPEFSYNLVAMPSDLFISIGQKQNVKIYAEKPANGAPIRKDVTKQCSWMVDDPSVAVVDNGKVTGVKKGDAVVTATWTDENGETLQVDINVNVQGEELEGISIMPDDMVLDLGKTKSFTVYAEYSNPNGPPKRKNITKDPGLTWVVDDPAVVAVDKGKVKALSSGEAAITFIYATAEGDEVECDLTVTVLKKVKKLTVDPKKLVFEEAGETDTVQLTAVYADGSTEDIDVLDTECFSTNPGCAYVNEDGDIEAYGPGSAKITFKYNGKSATLGVTVKGNGYYNNPGYNNPGYNNPGYNNPGYNNPGYNW